MKNNLFANVLAIIALVLAISVSVYVTVKLSDTPVKGDQGVQGIQGEQGLRGLQGVQGVSGKDGVSGMNGKDAIIDINYLAAKVKDLINPPIVNPIFSANGGNGNFAPQFSVATSSERIFQFTHFGSEKFEVSLVDDDGVVSVLVKADGHLQMTKVVSLTAQTYTLRVSASGDWSISIK